MRTENSIKNSIIAIASNVLIMLLGFIIQTVFIKTLGEEYLGINGLFNNIVSMLAIVELGIGPAIVSNLYKPLSDNDVETIKSLMNYYKRAYNVIATIVFVCGMFVIPFLHFFVNTNISFDNHGGIYTIYILFIIDAAFSYLYAYKRSIIQADQKNRIINVTHMVCYTGMIMLQIIILVLTKDYILFLLIKITFRILENVILSTYVDRKYCYLKGKSSKISQENKNSIFTKIKGMIYHKIGGYMVLGTDNIIISKFLGVGMVGLYSNYYLIINSLYILYCQIFSSLTASVGNLIVSETSEIQYQVYKKIMFLNFWIYGFSASALYCMMEPFVSIWLGEKYLLANSVLVMLVINFYMLGMRSSIGVFKDAAGIFYEDRFIPIIESSINIISSVILVRHFEMFGVFLGTFLSSIIVVFYSLPQYVFKKMFDKAKREYYKLYAKYVVITAVGVFLTINIYKIICSVVNTSLMVYLLIAIIVSAIVPNIIFMLILKNTVEFQYFKDMALQKLGRRKG